MRKDILVSDFVRCTYGLDTLVSNCFVLVYFPLYLCYFTLLYCYRIE